MTTNAEVVSRVVEKLMKREPPKVRPRTRTAPRTRSFADHARSCYRCPFCYSPEDRSLENHR